MCRVSLSSVALLIATTSVGLGAPPTGAIDAPMSVMWRLIGNLPEGGYQAEVSLHNDSAEVLSGNWTLYFNSASSLVPNSLPPEFTLTHINGDFYSLRPSKPSLQIDPGQSHSFTWVGTPWAINVSDAPAGFYLIFNEKTSPLSRPMPVALTIDPFPSPEKLRRGAADAVPVVTAESRYLANERLSKVPSEQLTKVAPTPLDVQPLPGQVSLRRTTKVIYEPRLINEATFLAKALGKLLDAQIEVVSLANVKGALTDAIRLRVDKVDVANLIEREGDESYILAVNRDEGVEIVGSDPAGVFYAIQTLRALLPIEAYREPAAELVLDAVQIVDAPRFSYRGLHLDVARNFQSKETVKKLLDLMAFYKLNRFHWHLTDDEGWRVEINQLPELTEFGGRRGHTLDETEHLIPSYGSGPFPDAAVSSGSGFYTQDDVVEVLQFARSRHIVVIPELDFPGHARAAIKSMEARHRRLTDIDPEAANEYLLREPGDASQYESVQRWRDNVVDVGLESTYRFLTVVIGELVEIYRRAGSPLISIHLGGDEVPEGAWDKSSACERIAIDEDSTIPRRVQLELHFLRRASNILHRHSIQPACWDDCLLPQLSQKPTTGHERRAADKNAPVAYVWNNVWGWGREDAAYKLANAGFDVVLCNATHLYFDLACEKDPWEPGYYWAGFVGMAAPFEFLPLDVFKNAHRDTMGRPLSEEGLADLTTLTSAGAQRVRGIQGQLWGENLRSPRDIEYMVFPRIIALAERAWAAPFELEKEGLAERYRQLRIRDWNQFANRLGQRELPRLDFLHGGFEYRLPPPGAMRNGDRVWANVEFPGLQIRYTTDGTDPTMADQLYRSVVNAAGAVRLRTFDTRGRGSRTVIILAP